MVPTTRQATKTKVGEEVLDLVIPYIHNVDDRSSVSLVSRNFYEVEGITRKHLTVRVHYYPNSACLSKRFPFFESLTLKGPPPDFSQTHYHPDIRITPWIKQLALEFRCSKELCIHRLVVHDEDLETLARTRECYLSKLGDAFRLENFGGYSCEDKSERVGFQIRKLKLVLACLDEDQKCLLFMRCTNVGLISLAKGCTNLESLDLILGNISNEALECVGTHLKNLGDFHMHLVKDDGTTGLLDNGIRAMLMGCRKLERLDISLWHGRLTDVGLEYIWKYGVNLRSLHLECVGNSNAGLVKLSQGYQKLRKLKLFGCPFSEQVVASYVFNIPSLRYVLFDRSDRDGMCLTRPDFQV
uniref:COI1 F-box domain-containing protein n=1 Tax=Tanacetum cinerariifolium TaxID=118510 RepID=A0A699I0M6_TANCI|nr:hypothetical protein [Tanacetum cinerariifolium]